MKFRDFASSVINDMARIASQQAATQLAQWSDRCGRVGSRRLLRRQVSRPGHRNPVTGNAYANWAAAQADGSAWANGVQFFANGAAFANSIVSRPTAFWRQAGDRMGSWERRGRRQSCPWLAVQMVRSVFGPWAAAVVLRYRSMPRWRSCRGPQL